MFLLSHYHYAEIKEVPELLEMVKNIRRENFLMFFEPSRFAELCMQHNCPETFLAVAPYANYEYGPIAELMQHNAVEIVQYMYENSRWKEAVRQVAKSGNRTHVQFVLDHTNTTDIYKYIVEGGCQGDHRSLVEEFLPKTLDPSVHSTASEIAVQCNAIECLGYLVNNMSSDTWAEALNEAVYYKTHRFKDSNIVSVLLDNKPEHICKDLMFWANLASVSLELDDARRVFECVFDNTTLDALLNCHGSKWYASDEKRQRLIEIHEYIALSHATESLGATSTRKMM